MIPDGHSHWIALDGWTEIKLKWDMKRRVFERESFVLVFNISAY